jgi:uncharacterized protein (DUF427 family)
MHGDELFGGRHSYRGIKPVKNTATTWSEIVAPATKNVLRLISDFFERFIYPVEVGRHMNSKRIEPGPGQESVWDYPRPPRLEDSTKRIRVIFNGIVIAETQDAKRVLETSHPPVYYVPLEGIKTEFLSRSTRKTWCEWKGHGEYYNVVVEDEQAADAAWFYPDPTKEFAAIKNYVAFYPGLMDACYVDNELVKQQPGGFYGGWITSDIVGPFKGEAGTWGW